MTNAQINLERKSWRVFLRISPAVVADAFYSKLFFDRPELRRIFPKNMAGQYQKLVDMLWAMVARLENLESFEQEIAALPKRHEGYGVKPKHYGMVGATLLWTLERGLGSDWNEETAEAWGACYRMISSQMQKEA